MVGRFLVLAAVALVTVAPAWGEPAPSDAGAMPGASDFGILNEVVTWPRVLELDGATHPSAPINGVSDPFLAVQYVMTVDPFVVQAGRTGGRLSPVIEVDVAGPDVSPCLQAALDRFPGVIAVRLNAGYPRLL
jgi:hypothetical protein